MTTHYKSVNHMEVIQMDDEWLALDTSTYSVTRLNESGGFCLSMLSEPRNSEDMASELENRYGISAEDAKRDVKVFLTHLLQIGLVNYA
ncbi:PqqD family protein [Paenibacillus montanisoli]|uniref:PqqD family protein n=1 Tax=Paenibacillus montanisoli TaxID=2081970 RepID=A0A328U5X0_9BACL|nr:PqqD family protein [Paenibacillus montanisoli]RAP77472.1 hypothetical protein DL346_03050 [Paenibacillus montanisoli]